MKVVLNCYCLIHFCKNLWQWVLYESVFLDWVGEMGYFTYQWQIVEPLWQPRLSLEYYNTKASFSAAKALSSKDNLPNQD